MIPQISLIALLGLAVGSVERVDAQQLTRMFRIGESDGVPELSFGAVSDLSFGPDSTIYVLDARNAVVRVYDFAGKHLRSFGRKGEGPGEFTLPTRLLVTSEGVTLFDLGRAASFTHDGTPVATRNLDDLVSGFTSAVPLRHGRWLLAKESIQTGPTILRLSRETAAFIQREGPSLRASTAFLVGVAEEGSTQVDTLFSYDHGFVLLITPRGVGPLPRSSGRGGGWAVAGDSLIALVDGLRGIVSVLRSTPSGLQQVRTHQAPVTPEEWGQREWRQMADEAFAEVGQDYRGHVVGPPLRPQLEQPFFSDDGRLWVRRIDHNQLSSTSDETTYLIFSPNEREAVPMTLPASILIASVKDDLILAKSTTDLGVDVVELWRYREPVR